MIFCRPPLRVSQISLRFVNKECPLLRQVIQSPSPTSTRCSLSQLSNSSHRRRRVRTITIVAIFSSILFIYCFTRSLWTYNIFAPRFLVFVFRSLDGGRVAWLALWTANESIIGSIKLDRPWSPTWNAHEYKNEINHSSQNVGVPIPHTSSSRW